jgi:hypothetical protein
MPSPAKEKSKKVWCDGGWTDQATIDKQEKQTQVPAAPEPTPIRP